LPVSSGTPIDRRRLWRALAAAGLPPLLFVWALWRDVYMFDAAGIVRVGGGPQIAEWTVLSAATLALAGLFWSASRSLRVLGYTFYALVTSVGFGAAGVLGVMHAFGGPQGNLAAPGWGLVLLAASAAACVGALLATAALLVEDVRAEDGGD
jgi:hypothetical protein